MEGLEVGIGRRHPHFPSGYYLSLLTGVVLLGVPGGSFLQVQCPSSLVETG